MTVLQNVVHEGFVQSEAEEQMQHSFMATTGDDFVMGVLNVLDPTRKNILLDSLKDLMNTTDPSLLLAAIGAVYSRRFVVQSHNVYVAGPTTGSVCVITKVAPTTYNVMK